MRAVRVEYHILQIDDTKASAPPLVFAIPGMIVDGNQTRTFAMLRGESFFG